LLKAHLLRHRDEKVATSSEGPFSSFSVCPYFLGMAEQAEEKKYTRIAAKTRRSYRLLLAPVVFWLVFLYLYPLLEVLRLSFFDPSFTLEHYLKFFSVHAYQKVLLSTFFIALLVTVITLFLGYPVAYLMASLRTRVSNLLMMIVLLTFWMSILVRTYAWMVLLGSQGLVNSFLIRLGLISSPLELMFNWFGVTVGMVHILLPFMILPLYSVMRGIDKNLIKAAENLGANSFQAFSKVFLPLSLPGIAAGSLLVFIVSLGFYITPSLLGGPKNMMISMLIDTHVNQLLNWGFASTLSIILLGVTLFIYFLYNRFLGLDKLSV
jgi:ABC-type spermidine/putrescine transport system permease subunit I